MNTLDIHVTDADGGPSSITAQTDRPVDVGGGVTFYRSRVDLDGSCSGEFHADSQKDKKLTAAALPLVDAEAPSKSTDPLCAALIPTGLTVLRALGWTR